MRPTHILEGNLLYSKSTDLNVCLILKKISSRQHLVWPNIWDHGLTKLTDDINHHNTQLLLSAHGPELVMWPHSDTSVQEVWSVVCLEGGVGTRDIWRGISNDHSCDSCYLRMKESLSLCCPHSDAFCEVDVEMVLFFIFLNFIGV